MIKRIAILVRHGDYHQLDNTPSAHQPFALNYDGFKQAEDGIALINELLNVNDWALDPEIHSSNLLRGWQTAHILCSGLQGAETVEGFDDLAERGLGSAANLSTEEIERVLEMDPRFETPPANWKSNSHYRLPLQGAESLMDAGKRVAHHIDDVMDKIDIVSEQSIAKIFVGHGAAFRHAAHHLGVLAFDEIAKLSMYHAHPVAIACDTAGNWSHVGGKWKVRGKKDNYLD